MAQREKFVGIFAQAMRRTCEDRLLSPRELQVVADMLGTSPRTLQRRLHAEGRTFRDLVDAWRRESAIALLSEGSLSVQEIASRLGYRQAGAFSRAFRRWMNCSPRDFRARQRRARASLP